MTVAEIVDLDRYPVHDPTARGPLVRSVAAQLHAESVAVLDGFVRPTALTRMARDADHLRPSAHRSRTSATAYLRAAESGWPSGHPRERVLPSSVETLAYDLLPTDDLVRELYESDVLMPFLAEVLDVAELHRYADPFGAVNVASMSAGDALGWHFDQTDFVTSIAIAAPESGGAFEVAAQVRTDMNENYDAVAAVLDGDRTSVTHVEFRPGALMLFAGRHSLHRVTEVRGNRPRHVALLAYDTRAGTDSSDELKLARYGRLPSSGTKEHPA